MFAGHVEVLGGPNMARGPVLPSHRKGTKKAVLDYSKRESEMYNTFL